MWSNPSLHPAGAACRAAHHFGSTGVLSYVPFLLRNHQSIRPYALVPLQPWSAAERRCRHGRHGGMAIPGSGKRRISPQLHARTCGQARRPLRYPGGGYSGRLHPVSAPGRRKPSSADTGRQKAGTVSNLPTTQRSAGQASAAGRVDKRPSVRSAFAIWWKTLVPIFHLCFACEVW